MPEKRKILFDTDILIGYFRRSPKSKTLMEKVKKAEFKAFISVITEAELYSGSFSDEEDLRIEAVLSYFKKITVNSGIAKEAGKLRAKYYRKCALRIPDALIAASAEKLSAELLTNNLKHFKFIAEISLTNAESI